MAEHERHRDVTSASRSHRGRGVGEGAKRNDVNRRLGLHQRSKAAFALGIGAVKIDIPWYPKSKTDA